MFGFRTKKKLKAHNEELRSMLSTKIVENTVLKAKIRAYEMADKLNCAKETVNLIELYGSELIQRSLLGSDYTEKWCKGRILDEIAAHFVKNLGDNVVFKTQIIDEKHAIVTGSVKIGIVKE